MLDSPGMPAASPLRLLHVIQTIDPRFGGPVTVVAELASQQVRDGHAVTICTTDRGHPPSRRIGPEALARVAIDPGVRIMPFEVQHAASLFSLPMLRWLRRHCRDFDVLHIHGLYRAPTVLAAWAARRAGIAHLIAPHGSLDPFLYRQSATSLWAKRLYERWLMLPALRKATAVHFTTAGERASVAIPGLGARSIVVPNGLDPARFFPAAPNRALRSRLGIGNEPLLLYLGRIYPGKGLDLLLPAFAAVRARQPAAKLAIVGPDSASYREQVAQWIREHALGDSVFVLDHLDRDRVADAYRDADAFVLPSYSENFAVSVIESLACGTPVIISDRVKIHDEIGRAGVGVVVPCAVPALAEAIDSLLSDRPRARAMGAKGEAFVRARYAWDSVSRQLADEYRRLIAANRTPIDATAEAA